MPLVAMDVGCQNLMTMLFSGSIIGWRVWPYKNNHVPTHTDTGASFTAPDYPGAAFAFANPVSVTTLGPGLGTQLNFGSATFTPTSGANPNDIYGYLMQESAVFGDSPYWAELDPAGPVVLADGSTSLTITPVLTFVSDNPTIFTPNSGTDAMAKVVAGLSGGMALPLTMHLYTSDTTPTTMSVLGDFTEVIGAWYSAQNLSGPVVTIPVAGAGALTTWTGLSWTPAGPITPVSVYGYYVTDANGVLMWAERAPTPPVILSDATTTLPITPRYGGDSAF